MSESSIFSALHQGPSNRFALGALTAVAHAPGEIYNPLWIYGPSGVGKTAMLNATVAALREHPSRPAILRIDAEQLLRDLICAIGQHATGDLRAYLLGFRVILVDHAEYLSGKSQAQLELGRLLAWAASQGCQVILSSAYSSRELENLDQTLRKYCPWFLRCDILLPLPEERIAITRRMARARELPLSDRMACRIGAAAHSPARIRCIIEHLAARRKLLQQEEADLCDALDHLLAREVLV